MHLKICPNPQCGKVSDFGVAVCEHCGQAFPKVAPAPETANVPPAASPKQGSVPGSAAGAAGDKPRIAAWPLIMVAVVAGGLPLLWANRASLPTPKPWRSGTPDATRVDGAASAPIANIKPPVVPELAPAPTQASTDSAVPSSVAPASTPASDVDQYKQTPTGSDEIAKKDPEVSPRTGDASKEAAKKSPRAPNPKKKEPPRPCTEATAALGLCDPKRPGQ